MESQDKQNQEFDSEGRNMMIGGTSRNGTSTLFSDYIKRFPPAKTEEIKPVMVRCDQVLGKGRPNSENEISVAEAYQILMNLPTSHLGMIMIDEVQHLVKGNTPL